MTTFKTHIDFSPSAQIHEELFNATANISDYSHNIATINFSINTEEDISREMNSIEKEATKNASNIDQTSTEISRELTGLIVSDFQRNLTNYHDLFLIFSANDNVESFKTHMSSFPWDDWLSLDKRVHYGFHCIQGFFSKDLLKANSEFYYEMAYDMLTCTNYNCPTKTGLFLSFFLEQCPQQNNEHYQAFISGLANKDNINSYVYDLLVHDKLPFATEKDIIGQFRVHMEKNENARKYFNNLYQTDYGEHFYISRKLNSNMQNMVKWDNFKKLIEFDLEHDIGYSNHLFATLLPLMESLKRYKDFSKYNDPHMEELAATYHKGIFEKKLEHKNSSSIKSKI